MLSDQEKFELTRAVNNSFLSLTIIPTMQCNLRCVYCYEEHKNIHISDSDISNIVKFIKEKANTLSKLHITWFGGEPLLKIRILHKLLDEVNVICEEKDIKFSSSIVTNATLLNVDVFTNLLKKNVKYFQITFDGDEEAHDKLRYYVNGRGSFRDIWENLLQYRERDESFTIKIRLHLNGENSESIKSFKEKFDRSFGQDSRFQLDYHTIFKSKVNQKETIVSDENMVESRKQFEEVIGQEERNRYICYAAKPNHWVINPRSIVSKCTVALENKANHVGYLSSDGKLNLNVKLANEWHESLLNLDWESMRCPLLGLKKKYKSINVVNI
ncbi:radical SAM protein [Vibrio sp. S9_S30]|uniref:radical SAM protein n=1 Tax=Vibrio sp. S9_S30 TaxID=2720226 RepID=UPI0016812532|nr:radical SAM protein [Vibrio sp. S9_S30]MBD1558149.1 radical SAM protein [Vibrio sp. S9_S30]